MIALAISSLYSSISAVVKAELFPVEIRALGVGLPYAIAVSLFGGSAEYIALWFKSIGHESWFYWYVTALRVLLAAGLRFHARAAAGLADLKDSHVHARPIAARIAGRAELAVGLSAARLQHLDRFLQQKYLDTGTPALRADADRAARRDRAFQRARLMDVERKRAGAATTRSSASTR